MHSREAPGIASLPFGLPVTIPAEVGIGAKRMGGPELYNGDLISRPDKAAFYDFGTNAAAPLQCPRHAGLGHVLDVISGRARPVILQDHLPKPEPAPAQCLQVHSTRDDIAPVLAVFDVKTLVLDLVEVLALYERNLADVAISGPIAHPLLVAVAFEPTVLNGANLLDTLHRRAALAGNVDLLDHACHHFSTSRTSIRLRTLKSNLGRSARVAPEEKGASKCRAKVLGGPASVSDNCPTYVALLTPYPHSVSSTVRPRPRSSFGQQDVLKPTQPEHHSRV